MFSKSSSFAQSCCCSSSSVSKLHRCRHFALMIVLSGFAFVYFKGEMNVSAWLNSEESVDDYEDIEHFYANEDCRKSNFTEKKNIAFIKTHKTAGTSIQNILLRYGLKHNLLFALPRNAHDFYYPQWFTKRMIVNFGQTYNIICHHMRFHHKRVRESMPPDTLFITSVREPGAQFVSTFVFFRKIVPAFRQVPAPNSYNGNYHDIIEHWLDSTDRYVLAAGGENDRPHLMKNPNFFDLGFENNMHDDTYISSAIHNIDSIFDLVLVADHFFESLVLLADLLCWNLEDVACFAHNARSKSSSDTVQDNQQLLRIREKVRKWNKADAALFDHFNETLWRRINDYGRGRMTRKVKKLQEIISDLMLECVDEGHAVPLHTVSDPSFRRVSYQPLDVSVDSYNLRIDAENVEKCRQLIEGENHFGNIVYKRQKSRFPIPTYVENMA